MTIPMILGLSVAIIVSLIPVARKYIINPFITLIHEMGHAVANILTLGKPTGIKIYFANKGGVTHSVRKGGLPVMNFFGGIFAGLSGYPAPVILGLALICYSAKGHGIVVSIIMLALTIMCLVLMRSLTGLLVTLLSAGFFALSIWWPEYSERLMSFAGGVYLIGGLMDIAILAVIYKHGKAEESDLGILRERFPLPMWFWYLATIAYTLFFSWIILLTSGFLPTPWGS